MRLSKVFSHRTFIGTITLLSVIFLMAPIVVVAVMSFAVRPAALFPPQEWTIAWYREVITDPVFRSSLFLSLVIALAATVTSLTLGTAASISIVRFDFRGAKFIEGMLMSPLVFPGLVVGLMLLKIFATMSMFNPLMNLVLAHTLMTLPYVIRTVTASLRQIDVSLEDAARTLGASEWMVFRRITTPQIAGGLVAGGIFAFIMSFDNFVVSLWLADAGAVPLPILIFRHISSSFTPSITAEATIMVGFGIVSVVLLELTVGLRKSLSH